jgi:hypothetical protein
MPEPLDVTTLEAGRELDARIAELLGWKNVRFDGEEVTVDAHSFTRYPMGWHGEKPGLPPGWRTDIPHYSTYIGAAWEVVEQLIERGVVSVRLEWWGGSPDEGPDWEAIIDLPVPRPPSQPDCVVLARADTAPLAICRAALQAIA